MAEPQINTASVEAEINRINNIVATIRDGVANGNPEISKRSIEIIGSLLAFCEFYYSFSVILLEQYPILNTAVKYADDLSHVYKTLDTYLEQKGILVVKEQDYWYWSHNESKKRSSPFQKAILAYLDAVTNQ